MGDRSFIKEIDAFRGIAALLVFYFHVNLNFPDYWEILPDYNVVWSFLFEGHTGVILFFVISGFLLSRKWALNEPVDLKDFYINRAIRIIPLYYLSIIFYMTLGSNNGFTLGEILPYFLFLQNTLVDRADLGGAAGVYWSLGPEFFFYLLLPFLMIVLRRKRDIVGLIVASVAFNFFIPEMTDSIFGRLNLFAIGILGSFLYYRNFRNRKICPAFVWSAVILSSIGLLLLLHNLSSLGGYKHLGKHWMHWTFQYTTEAILWMTLVISVVLLKSKIKLIIINKPFSFVGTISYSMYIWHYLIVLLMRKYQVNLSISIQEFLHVGANTAFFIYSTVIVLPLVLIVSFVSYIYIEKPFLQFRKHKKQKDQDVNIVANNGGGVSI